MSERQATPEAGSPGNYCSVALDVVLSGGALGIILASVLVDAGSLPSVSVCGFNRLTGLPCPGCGITRAFFSIGHGRFGSAWDFHPFSFLFYAAAIVLVFWPLVRRMAPDIEKRLLLSPWFTSGAILLLVAMWVFGASRILGSLCTR